LDGRRVTVPTGTSEEREDALASHLQPVLRRSPVAEIERVLPDLRRWAGRSGDPAELGRSLDPEELARLAASELIDIGSHSRSHSSLPALAPEAQREEIGGSGQWLRETLGIAARSFAYPFGDNRRQTRRLAREAGFEHAVAAEARRGVTRRSPRFALPRTSIRNEGFEETLEALLA
jgi:Polysaccharide deacetylase